MKTLGKPRHKDPSPGSHCVGWHFLCNLFCCTPSLRPAGHPSSLEFHPECPGIRESLRPIGVTTHVHFKLRMGAHSESQISCILHSKSKSEVGVQYQNKRDTNVQSRHSMVPVFHNREGGVALAFSINAHPRGAGQVTKNNIQDPRTTANVSVVVMTSIAQKPFIAAQKKANNL